MSSALRGNWLIAAVLAQAAAGSAALAQGAPGSDAPAPPPAPSPTTTPPAPTTNVQEPPAAQPPAAAPQPQPPAETVSEGPSDEELLKGAEAIEIFDERPDKPFDRDTEVRLTGEQLAKRGAVDLGSALALLPDVTIRDGGRGGFNLDVRGGRKSSVTVMIDGVVVDDPYYGTFDVSSIPITDIVQIRVATTPQSPIDGPGGSGGVIEVHTRDAIGPQLVIARMTGDSLPSIGATATARFAVAKYMALRLSASGLLGSRDLELPSNATLDEGRRAQTGSGRFEYRRGKQRIAVDAFVDNRHYISPPSDTEANSIVMIDRETTERVSAKYDDTIGKLQIQGQAWGDHLYRRSRFFMDPSLTSELQFEDLSATRVGGMALATQPITKEWRWAASTSVDHESANVGTMGNPPSTGDLTIIEPAADLQYEHERVRVDAAAGAALPIGVGAKPWPEFKVATKYKPIQDLELTATGGYKGRLPTLRERFDSQTGNPALGPEKVWHAEIRAVDTMRDGLRIEVAPFYRHANGTTRLCPDPALCMAGKQANLGILNIYGVDTMASLKLDPRFEFGGSYNYIQAKADTGSNEPLDRLPHHRFDAWVQSMPTKQVSVLARAKYFGASFDQGNRLGGYTLLEANVSANIAKHYLGVLRVDDLLDVRPETRAGYHSPGRVVSIVLQGDWE